MDDQARYDTQSLSDLIGSRLCHDVSSPLGAVGNGVELLDMTGSARGPEMDLIRAAVTDALARVRFLRLAFGYASPSQMISMREAKDCLESLYAQSRVQPLWRVDRDLPREQVKTAFLMMLCVEVALPMGGRVEVSCSSAGQWTLSATSDRVAVDETLWGVLRYGQAAAERALKPSEAQFPALHLLAERLGMTLNFVHEDNGLRLTMA